MDLISSIYAEVLLLLAWAVLRLKKLMQDDVSEQLTEFRKTYITAFHNAAKRHAEADRDDHTALGLWKSRTTTKINALERAIKGK
jgi:hypothetical protein